VSTRAGHGEVRRRPGARLWNRGNAVVDRGRQWVEGQDPVSRKGAAITWVRRYRLADGELYALLITAYMFMTLLPALLVLSSYVESDPHSLADHVTRRLGLTGSTASLFHDVLLGVGERKVGATIIAIGDLALFGAGFGRALQLAHSRAWQVSLGKPVLSDQLRYIAALFGLVALLLLFVVQASALSEQPGWISWAVIPGWLLVVIAYFVWMPHSLLHGFIPVRRLLPGAVLAALGIVGMRLLSHFLLVRWLNWYSKYYGGFGILMALFFWLMIAATIVVVAAALSPVLAERRDALVRR
jgi:membrane protein